MNKIATYQKRDGDIVCGNGDYQVKFAFDSEWDALESKIARFIWNGQYADVPIDADGIAQVPEFSDVDVCEVGVYSTEKHTTTSAMIPCLRSILCKSGKESEGAEDLQISQALDAAVRAEQAADRAQQDTTALEERVRALEQMMIDIEKALAEI